MTSCFARRPTASTRRPATASANASGACVPQRPGPSAPRAHDRRADDARAQVARDGLDLGKLRHARPSLRGERRDRRLERQLVGLGGDRVGARQRRHRLPVVADLDVDDERDRQRQRPFHGLADDRREGLDLVAWRLEQQLVVDLQEQPGVQSRPRNRSATRIIAIFWMSAAVPWMGMLIAIRSPAPRSAGFEARSSGIWRLRPRSVSTQPWALACSLIAIM